MAIPNSLATVGKTMRNLGNLSSQQQQILRNLPQDDQMDFERIRNDFRKYEIGKNLEEHLFSLRCFIEKRIENRHLRAILVGYIPSCDGVFLINSRHLTATFSICKSTLANGFAKIGLNKDTYSIDNFNCPYTSLIKPMLVVRQWVVRVPKKVELIHKLFDRGVSPQFAYDALTEKLFKEKNRIDDLQSIVDYESSLYSGQNIWEDYMEIKDDDESNDYKELYEHKTNIDYITPSEPSVEPLPIL